MRPQSMTGFGRARGPTRVGQVVVEIRSTNHRFCEISIRVPEWFGRFEEEIRQQIRRVVRRGRLVVTVEFEPQDAQEALDWDLIEQRYQQLSRLKRQFHLKEAIGLSHLIAVVGTDRRPRLGDVTRLWPSVRSVVEQAVAHLETSRRREGLILVKELARYAGQVRHRLQVIRRRLPHVIQRHSQKIRARLGRALGKTVDPREIQQQIASLEQELDVSEELTRAQAHLGDLERVLKDEPEVGKRLEFMLQELMREVNTIGSKANDYQIEKASVEIKTLLEKLREQVQNLE